MAGKHHTSTTYRERSLYTSPIFIFIISLLSLLFIIIFFSSSSSSSLPSSRSSLSAPNPNPNIEYSFFASLEHFLTEKLPNLRRASARDDAVSAAASGDDSVSRLDWSIWKTENDRLYEDSFFPASSLPVRVYVYEMPDKFTYDLLWLFRKTYKETVNLTSNGSPVHRLIEQHSIDYWLWADLTAPSSERLLKNVVRVRRQEEADLFYVPFFTTISFFLLEKQQCKALYRVKL